MAITRAQQAKQLLANGGRIGLFLGGNFKGGYSESRKDSGAKRGPRDDPDRFGPSNKPTSSSTNREKGMMSRYEGPGGTTGNITNFKDRPVERPSERYDSNVEDLFPGDKVNLQVDLDPKDPRRVKDENKDIFTKTATGKKGNETFIDRLNNRNRKFFYDKVLKGNLQNYNLTELDDLYGKYMEGRTSGGTDAYGRDIIPPGRDDPIMVGNMFNQNQGVGDNTEDQEPEEPFVPNFRLMADGGRAALAEGGMPYEGGIMDLESARQMYGLGKLVKKITRGVKKVAKSPIGKAALMYFGGQALMGGGAGGGLKSFFGKGSFNPFKFAIGAQPGMDGANPGGFGLSGLGKIAQSLGLVGTEGALTGMGKIAIPTIASYFMTPKEEDSDEELNLGADLPFPVEYYLSGKYKPNPRLAANGGIMRLNYAEGSEEPVAKKTMPLLDMDGQEMDLRQEGGFVPLGRMEKADDVPARLSKNEFVFTADAVRNAGEGDVDKGAEVMYNMMKNLESGGEVSEESQGLEGAREMFQTSQRLEEVI